MMTCRQKPLPWQPHFTCPISLQRWPTTHVTSPSSPADPKSFVVEEKSTEILTYTIMCIQEGYRSIHILSEKTNIATVAPHEHWEMFASDVAQSYNVSVHGLAFGRTSLNFDIGNDSVPLSTSYDIAVFRKHTHINLVYQIVLGEW